MLRAPEPSPLPTNRSISACTVMPVLVYPDVREAVAWLCHAFGFVERLQIGTHRSQLLFGDGGIIIGEPSADAADVGAPEHCRQMHSVLVRVADVDAHHERAAALGARVLRAPATYPYGERQYTAEDPAGHRWTFSQSIADVDPADWGGVLVTPDGSAR